MKGYDSQFQLITQLLSNNDIINARKHMETILDLDMILACPMSTSFFLGFLRQELNSENLECYLDIALVQDFAEVSLKTAEFEFTQVELNTNPDAEDTVEFRAGMIRVENFFNNYIGKEAKMEINIPALSLERVTSLYSKALDMVKTHDQEIKELRDSGAEQIIIRRHHLENLRERSELIEECMKKLRNDLRVNLMDPFKRFLQSPQWHEAFSLFATSNDEGLKLKKRVMASNFGGVVINSQRWNAIREARHPILAVTETLEGLLALFRQGDCWNVVEGKISSNIQNVVSHMCGLNLIAESFNELQAVNLDLLTNDYERMAFWVMVHNATVIMTTISAEGVPLAYLDRAVYPWKIRVEVAGNTYSLWDIKNTMLRGRENQVRHNVLGKSMKTKDTRWKYAIQEPNKHGLMPVLPFLLCDTSSKSSPRVRVLQPVSFIKDLDDMINEYLDHHIVENNGVSTIPNRLHELKIDMKTNAGVISFVKGRLTSQKNNQFVFDKPEEPALTFECAVEPRWLNMIAKGQVEGVVHGEQVKQVQETKQQTKEQPISQDVQTPHPSPKRAVQSTSSVDSKPEQIITRSSASSKNCCMMM
jgi:hypothetical protein